MAIIKYNNGLGAILCESCRVIIATGKDIPSHLLTNNSENEHYFCSEECKNKYLEKEEKRCIILTRK